ncbi:TPA: hypothetical protein N0F65_012659 [Lagenidium giganteum]|uniref:ATP-dependent DNA helicase n=1 Tax=Lagenidium giganteum TaxID=4803 RepID=A0AAV2YIX4_9STRA|nr:TPA: hypothetical protein N0F65_012659 [Lagenidium giganteum]
MPKQLRQLFATILVYCQLLDHQRTFESSSEDRKVVCATVRDVNDCLLSSGKCLQDYPSLPQLEEFADISVGGEQNPLLRAERSFNLEQLEATAANSHLLNEDQRVVYESVIEAERDPDNNDRWFFFDGPGGTGKSFVLEQILARVRLDGFIAVPVASSGIAALLLTGGRTVHSRFKLPLGLTEVSICSISKQSNLADLYRETSLIIWDEATMAHPFALEAVDRSLRDITGVDRPFGGIVMLLSEDFGQILPVVPRGTDGDVINACLKRSNLWRELKTLRLTINMRVRTCSRASDAADIEAFSTFLLKIGEGKQRSCQPTWYVLLLGARRICGVAQ